MKRILTKTVCAAAFAAVLPLAAQAATAVLKSPDGQEMGALSLTQTGDGVLIQGEIRGLTPGEHAFHIHETGKCEAPDFKSAGGHYNPGGAPHGKHADGPHAGDMDNLVVMDSGPLAVDVVNDRVTLSAPAGNTLFDADGSAIVIHEGPDDYRSQPAGDAGGRVACGVIE